MAYAYGIYNDAVVEMVRSCGIDYARTVEDTEGFSLPTDWLRWNPTCHHRNPRLMDLAQDFLEEQKGGYWRQVPKLFYLWGHSYEFEGNNNWHVIEEFTDRMAGKEDDIWYATNIEIYEYIEAYGQLRWSADGNIVHNPTATTLYFNYGATPVVLAPGETKVF